MSESVASVTNSVDDAIKPSQVECNGTKEESDDSAVHSGDDELEKSGDSPPMEL